VEIKVRLPGHSGAVVAAPARGVAALSAALFERTGSAGPADDSTGRYVGPATGLCARLQN
jgi:hypothetical protein